MMCWYGWSVILPSLQGSQIPSDSSFTPSMPRTIFPIILCEGAFAKRCALRELRLLARCLGGSNTPIPRNLPFAAALNRLASTDKSYGNHDKMMFVGNLHNPHISLCFPSSASGSDTVEIAAVGTSCNIISSSSSQIRLTTG